MTICRHLKVFSVIFMSLVFFIEPVGAKEQETPLSANHAFQLQIDINKHNQVMATFTVAPGYYLYRDKIDFVLIPAPGVKLGAIVLPAGQKKRDSTHESYEVYSGQTQIPIALEGVGADPVILEAHYQGCSYAGFCYPPIKKQVEIQLSTVRSVEEVTPKMAAPQKMVSGQDYAEQLLKGQKFFFILLSFFGLGVLLAFTPCVLPLVPILSGIIAGHSRKHLTTAKAFFLSVSYVFGMALTYMVLGIVVALLGSSVQAAMQTPWVIGIFSGFFVILAFSLFGFYELHFPNYWQKFLMKWDKHFKGGTYSGVFLMGCFSSLIVSPCVSAPLVGVLAYIAQKGNVVLGASALFALGIGMGIPLLLVGASIGKLLPKSGPWMLIVQKIIGILMLGIAVWFLSRVISDQVTILLWVILLILSAVLLGLFKRATTLRKKSLKALGIIFLGAGILLIVSPKFENGSDAHFMVIKEMEQLDRELAKAKQQNKPVLLDFYADWCISCKEMQKNVFGDAQVQHVLNNFVLLQADVTQNNKFDQALLNRYQVVAPPTVVFVDANSHVLSQKLVGEVNKKKFLQYLQELNLIAK